MYIDVQEVMNCESDERVKGYTVGGNMLIAGVKASKWILES